MTYTNHYEPFVIIQPVQLKCFQLIEKRDAILYICSDEKTSVTDNYDFKPYAFTGTRGEIYIGKRG